MIHQSPSIAAIIADSNSNKMNLSDRPVCFVEKQNSCDFSKMLLETSSQEEYVFKWIEHGITFELECLQSLGIKTTSSDISKENISTSDQSKKLLIRLPFIDWKTTFSRAKDIHANKLCQDTTTVCKNPRVEIIGQAVSKIVKGWLHVLTRLGDPDSPTCCDGTMDKIQNNRNISGDIVFYSNPLRSQIYHRLMLLLLGFVDVIDSPQVQKGDRSWIAPREMTSTMTAEESKMIVNTVFNLARKILKEAGSVMKQNVAVVQPTSSSSTSYDPSSASNLGSRRMVEADGIYYYCYFTAIAAECSEYLGDQKTALLAYKSIRALEDRQLETFAGDSVKRSVSIYASKGETGFESRIVEENFTTTISGHISSPKVTGTKTPANTPEPDARKKHAKRNDVTACSQIAVPTKNGHNSATYSLCNRRNENSLFSAVKVKPSSVSLGSGRIDNSKNCTTDSRIGNGLIPFGTLEERIRRCSF